MLGNEENMKTVREAMQAKEQADKVNMGGSLEHGVPVDYKGIYGTHYEGLIVFKRPTMIDYMQMGSIKAKLLGSFGAVNLDLVDPSVKMMAQAMSTLKVAVTKAPSWLLDNSG